MTRCYGLTVIMCENSLFEGDFGDFGVFRGKIGHLRVKLSKNVEKLYTFQPYDLVGGGGGAVGGQF